MPKRKLSELADDNVPRTTTAAAPHPYQNQYPPPDQGRPNYKLQKSRLKAKFELGVTALSRALKAARGSERQKLGRRQKTAKEGPAETIKRIDGEIQVLKDLDPTKTAEKYLFKQLLKTKRIAESAVFIRFRQAKESKISIEGPKSTEEANVTARLFKSTPVKNVLPGIMDGLRGLFHLETPAEKKEKNAGPDSAKPKEKGEKVESVQRRRGSDISDEDPEDKSHTRDVDMSDAESDEEYAHFAGRLGSDSDDDSDDNDISKPKSNRNTLATRSSMSISPYASSASPEPTAQRPQTKGSKAPATSTTFLPSLMMGGYWSGSESEAEELDAAPVRKNRMGQQARRALWEKKFGASANHVKNEERNGKKRGKNGQGRDNGWDARKGAVGEGRGSKFSTGSNAMAMTGTNRLEGGGPRSGSGKKPQDDNKPLHPSWEAARKAKEQKASASFSGKKVVFD